MCIKVGCTQGSRYNQYSSYYMNKCLLIQSYYYVFDCVTIAAISTVVLSSNIMECFNLCVIIYSYIVSQCMKTRLVCNYIVTV